MSILNIWKNLIGPELESSNAVRLANGSLFAPYVTTCLIPAAKCIYTDKSRTVMRLPFRCLVGDLFILHRYFHGHCSQMISDIIPCPLRRVRTTETQLIHILSKCYCLIHKLYPANRNSSQEHAIYGTSYLLLAFLAPTTCHLSNLTSINLIWSLSPLSYSLSSFFLCWGFV